MATAADKARAKAVVAGRLGPGVNGTWLNVTAGNLAAEVNARIDKPTLVDQNTEPFCGYASIVFSLADKFPIQYAEFVTGLYRDGKAYVGIGTAAKQLIEPSDDLRNVLVRPRSRNPRTGAVTHMPAADWMALASLREHFAGSFTNALEALPRFGPIIPDWLRGSTAREVMRGLSKLGCSATYDQTSMVTHRGIGYLRAASDHYKNGRIVICCINAKMLDHNFGSNGGPGHWVTLISEVQETGDAVDFSTFSWGDVYPVRGPREGVLGRFFGYVVGYL